MKIPHGRRDSDCFGEALPRSRLRTTKSHKTGFSRLLIFADYHFLPAKRKSSGRNKQIDAEAAAGIEPAPRAVQTGSGRQGVDLGCGVFVGVLRMDRLAGGKAHL